MSLPLSRKLSGLKLECNGSLKRPLAGAGMKLKRELERSLLLDARIMTASYCKGCDRNAIPKAFGAERRGLWRIL